jgi:hypothetical protein
MKIKNNTTFTVLACLGLGQLVSHGALVAHYKLDEDSGTTAADELGNSDGAINGTVTRVAGVDGGAFQFDGNVTNNVHVANAPFLAGSGPGAGLGGDFTISAWISYTDVSSNVAATITLVDQDGPNDHYTDLSRIGNGAFGGGKDGEFYGRTRTGVGANLLQTDSPDAGIFNDGTFHHVAFVVDSTNEMLQVYVDGNLDTSASGAPILAEFSDLTNRHLDRPSGQSNVDAFTGLIDDVQVYDEALTSAQVDFLSNNAGQAIPEPTSSALAGLGLLALLRRKRRDAQ